MMRRSLATTMVVTTLMLSLAAARAQDAGAPAAEDLADAYGPPIYSPYAHRDYPEVPLWGDSHLHTSLSIDAGLFGNTLPPSEAYRFARGEEVVSSTGQPVRLSRPLDWLVVADHSDGMGMIDALRNGTPEILAFEQGAQWNAGLRAGGQAGADAALNVITNFAQGNVDPEMFSLYQPGSRVYRSVWDQVLADAEAFNDPGRFTALIGFEWTSLIAGNNMHRVVIFRDDADKASRVEPFVMTPPWGSPDPRDLWTYLENYEDETGGEVLAIPHNGNLSNGIMFPLEAQWNGVALDESYVTQRQEWEPLYEVTQIKGDGEVNRPGFAGGSNS